MPYAQCDAKEKQFQTDQVPELTVKSSVNHTQKEDVEKETKKRAHEIT